MKAKGVIRIDNFDEMSDMMGRKLGINELSDESSCSALVAENGSWPFGDPAQDEHCPLKKVAEFSEYGYAYYKSDGYASLFAPLDSDGVE